MHLLGKNFKPALKFDDAGVRVMINTAGKLQVYLASVVLPGRGSVYTLENAASQTSEARRKSVARVAAALAMRQNDLWGDRHNPEEVIRKADSCLDKVMRTGNPVAALGVFSTFRGREKGDIAKKTSEIASRASEDDPFTRDFLKGKNWE